MTRNIISKINYFVEYYIICHGSISKYWARKGRKIDRNIREVRGMKRFLIMIIFILLLTGCGENTDSQDSQKENMFVYIQPEDYKYDYDVVYHRDTKVMYAVSHGPYNYGTFTLLVNPDGTPMLYELESNKEDEE